MNERLESTIICCARLSEGATPLRVAADFVKKVELTTGLSISGMARIGVFVKLHGALKDHGNIDKALREAGL